MMPPRMTRHDQRRFPSEQTLRVLAAVYYGLPPAAGRSSLRGMHSTLCTCVYRGALTADHQITDYGVQLLVDHKSGGSNANT
jgi:hypothetical protein